MFPTLRNGLKNPPTPRARLPEARPAVRPETRPAPLPATPSMVTGRETVPAESGPMIRCPAMRPTRRTPIPNTRPMVCGFIPDYDGISGDAGRFFASYLLYRSCRNAALDVRYINPNAAPSAPSRRSPSEVTQVTSRLRELIQQLGEAIHESVIESEQIAGVVQDIRKHGFDVLLMLEATIGLNEVGSKEGAEDESASEEGAFTQNDLNFLKSLRISVEGGGDDETEEP
jgi:hypothetical protein